MIVSPKSWHWRTYYEFDQTPNPSICRYVVTIGLIAPVCGIAFCILIVPLFVFVFLPTVICEKLGLEFKMKFRPRCPFGTVTVRRDED